MFFEALGKLTTEQMHALADAGIPHPRISEWRKGKRIPTRPQALALATITGIDFGELEKELTLIEANQRAADHSGFAQFLRSAKRTIAHAGS